MSGKGWTKEDGAAASRRYYERNASLIRQRQDGRRRAVREVITDLKRRPCEDCAVEYPPYVMEWDHRPGEEKLFCIGSRGPGLPLQRVLDEIAKCDLVCANCHRERTAKRSGW